MPKTEDANVRFGESAHLYKGSLERAGYEVQISRDGKAGLDFLSQNVPDAVLLDVMVPGISGIELLKQIRADHRLANLPVVVYTNAFIPKLTEEAKLAGATEVFAKAQLTRKCWSKFSIPSTYAI